MVTKAIVEEVIDNYHIRVRIPFYNKIKSAAIATPTENLSIASISALPNAIMNFKYGDIVFVAFEDNRVSQPVIIGQLSREAKTGQNPSVRCSTIRSDVDAYLPEYTSIGNVTPADIKCLEGTKKNLQVQLDILEQKVAKLEERLNTHTYGILLDEGNKTVPTQEDAEYVLKIGAGLVTPKAWQKIAADVNEDGYINSTDSLLIQNYISDPVVGQYGKVGQTFVYKED